MNGNILIVDDEREFTDMLVELLTMSFPEFNIYSAYNGHEATVLFDQHDFNLVITDNTMPRMDGFELIHYVHSKNRHQQIMVIPGIIGLDEVKNCIKLGASCVLPKPFQLEVFLERVTSCLMNSFLE